MAIIKVRDENGDVIDIPAIVGPPGADYVLTESDKAEIAELAAELVEVPEGGNGEDGFSPIATVEQTADGAVITITDKKASIDHNKCVGCGRCIGICPMDAVKPAEDESNDILNCKIAEYAQAVVQGRPNFHISLVCDVSPYCDCHGENDAPIIPDVGMFASFDPVALDMACADACNAQPVLAGSLLDEKPHVHHDHFKDTHPETNWMSSIEHAVKLGIGSKEYELIEI